MRDTPHTVSSCALTDGGRAAPPARLTVSLEELRFRPAAAAAAAPCLLTVQLAPGATPQQVHLVRVPGGGGGDSGDGSPGARPDAAGVPDAGVAWAEGEPGATGAARATPRLHPGESHTFKIEQPGGRAGQGTLPPAPRAAREARPMPHAAMRPRDRHSIGFPARAENRMPLPCAAPLQAPTCWPARCSHS
jgi:hypothetical protein